LTGYLYVSQKIQGYCFLIQNCANLAGRSDWDDGRWEWEDTPRRQDSHSHTSRRHQPSPSPMLLGASPDARLVSPWLGGHTPLSSGMLARCEFFSVYVETLIVFKLAIYDCIC
jgi:hypothetical protein